MALLLIGLCGAPVFAHKPSDSYLSVDVAGTRLSGQWDIALRDLDYAIGLDANDDGLITWHELRTREGDIAAYALTRLRLAAGDTSCPMHFNDLLVDRHSDGAYAVLRFGGACRKEVEVLSAEYRLLFDLDPQHRGLARVTANGLTQTTIFSPERATQELHLGFATPTRQFLAFLREGIRHIWAGIDHVLFLLALLLPAMFVHTKTGWKPVAGIRGPLVSVVAIVTAFTAAHSITLSLAVLGIASLPSRWVETAIAASVLLAALNNLYPVVQKRLWAVAFVFGLIHGFGFASVLLDMELPRPVLILSLVAFNLGVEAGQLAVVVLYFGVAFVLHSTRVYRPIVLSAGSAAIALVASGWMLERAFDLQILP